jgi:NAD(P)-dependent dehydrogenase (short-subunit alcohol dehydrogenase family)
MARVFITGSSDGLGMMAAKLLMEQGHDVVLHGRNDQRCRDARAGAPGAKDAVSGDFSTIAGAKSVADRVNELGRFDAVIHNAGIGYRESRRVDTESGVPSVFARRPAPSRRRRRTRRARRASRPAPAPSARHRDRPRSI